MASIKERFVIAHLRHIASRQHPLVHQRKRGNLHGKQFPHKIYFRRATTKHRAAHAAAAARPPTLAENLEKGLSKVNCSAMDGSNC